MKFFALILSILLLNTSFSKAIYSSSRIIVKLKGAQIPTTKIHSSWKKLFSTTYVVKTKNVEALKEELDKSPKVIYTEFDFYSHSNQLPKLKLLPKKKLFLEFNLNAIFNDPYLSRQYTLFGARKNGMSVLEAFEQSISHSKTQIIVAVVDTGVDYKHRDLPIWTNENEIPGNGIDDDQNGYIDDIHGINTLVRDSDGNATMNMQDAHGHGTHVSGSIGAIQNNNIGIAGVATNVKIMGIRTVPNSSDELDVDVIEAFIYAAQNGARIINCSFGKSHNEGGLAVSEAMSYIGKEFGVLIVAAAGNSSQNIDQRKTYPASFTNENLLVVASSTSSGALSYFSNYGIVSVDVVAPGSGIYSLAPKNRYASMSGTSMASPNTAGAAAEVLSQFPELTPVQLKNVLMRSVTKKRLFSNRVGSGGRVNLLEALKIAKSLF